MSVRCIFVETTVPLRIRPRIETKPVKGHFLSVPKSYQKTMCREVSLERLVMKTHTDVGSLNRCLRGPEAQTDIFVPSPSTLADSPALGLEGFVVEEDVGLFLKGTLGLDR